MADKSLLLTGDFAKFENMEGASLFPPPLAPPLGSIPMKGSSSSSVLNRTVCIEGDEKEVKLTYTYIAPGYPIPGIVLCTIEKLDSSQLSPIASCDDKKVLYVGSGFFTAKYSVTKPAQQLPPPAGGGLPHTKLSFSGKGKFIQLIDLKVEEI